MINVKSDPIIIVGMHRSGTSLLSRVLENNGVFMGIDKENNNENLFFLNMNIFLLHKHKSEWNHPNKIKVDNRTYIEFKKLLQSRRNAWYFGSKTDFFNPTFKEDVASYGWKDPRNSITIPYWRKLFPRAKIVHIIRNPIDVANSLKKREEKFKTFSKIALYKKWGINYITGKPVIFNDPNLLSIDKGIELWNNYLSVFYSYNLKDYIEIKYEELLENPETVLKQLSDYLALIVKDTITIKKTRKHAFLEDENLVKKYLTLQNDPLIQKTGYGNIL